MFHRFCVFYHISILALQTETNSLILYDNGCACVHAPHYGIGIETHVTQDIPYDEFRYIED